MKIWNKNKESSEKSRLKYRQNDKILLENVGEWQRKPYSGDTPSWQETTTRDKLFKNK